MSLKDTIIAQATPIGRGGIGIIRISGINTKKIAISILKKIPKPRYANYLNFYDNKNNILDKGIALWFPKPKSFTGEDVLELHGHGGPIIINLIIKNILKTNKLRIARPGEFIERAFLNNKIDLIKVESIYNLINANSILSAKLALSSFNGKLSLKINKIIKLINDLRLILETKINFPEENINLIKKNEIKKKIDFIIINIENIIKKKSINCNIFESIKIIIIGAPNVGKSSLINILTGKKNSIVTNLSGTTRDILYKKIQFDNILVNIIDTAGLRNTKNKIEKIGIKNTIKEIKNIDHILFIINNKKNKNFLNLNYKFIKNIPINLPITFIKNKIDLTKEKSGIFILKNYKLICISIIKKKGINLIKKYLKKKINLNNIFTEGKFILNIRHLESFKKVSNYLLKYKNKKNYFEELLAEDLLLVIKELNKIIGIKTEKNIINKIFSKFCIGK